MMAGDRHLSSRSSHWVPETALQIFLLSRAVTEHPDSSPPVRTSLPNARGRQRSGIPSQTRIQNLQNFLSAFNTYREKGGRRRGTKVMKNSPAWILQADSRKGFPHPDFSSHKSRPVSVRKTCTKGPKRQYLSCKSRSTQ